MCSDQIKIGDYNRRIGTLETKVDQLYREIDDLSKKIARLDTRTHGSILIGGKNSKKLF